MLSYVEQGIVLASGDERGNLHWRPLRRPVQEQEPLEMNRL